MPEMILQSGFSDLDIDGRPVPSPFRPGDSLRVLAVKQTCSELGCCEVWYMIDCPDVAPMPFWAAKYFDKREIPDFAGWHREAQDDGAFIYTPPNEGGGPEE